MNSKHTIHNKIAHLNLKCENTLLLCTVVTDDNKAIIQVYKCIYIAQVPRSAPRTNISNVQVPTAKLKHKETKCY